MRNELPGFFAARALAVGAVSLALLATACLPPSQLSVGHAPMAAAPPAGAGREEPPDAAAHSQETDTWVATHAITALWAGPGPEDPIVGRLPVGSYFLVLGTDVDGRLPARYLGNASVPAVDAWVDAAALGPIPPPGADWIEPDWPPRRLILGVRGELIRGDPSLPLVALTFDAGAGSGAVEELLDVLASRNVRATFFVAGAFADRYPHIVWRMDQEGHELANHSYTHPDFRRLSEAEMRSEIRRATAAIEAAAGAPIARLWRPPFGGRDDRVLRVVEGEGLRSIFWTFDSGDWLTGATVDSVRSAVLRQAVPGAVVVHHVSPFATARAMPSITDELRRRGYELVTVSDLIGP